MLAVHQEEQEALYQHIKGVLPDDRLPVSARACRCLRPQVNRVLRLMKTSRDLIESQRTLLEVISECLVF